MFPPEKKGSKSIFLQWFSVAGCFRGSGCRSREGRFWFFVYLFALLVVVPVFQRSLHPEDLWTPGSLYRKQEFPTGTVVKIHVDDPVEISFDYENLGSDETEANGTKGSGSLDFLPAFEMERNYSGKRSKRMKARGRLRFDMAATILRREASGMLVLEGRRTVIREEEDLRMDVVLQGTIHPADLGSNREISSAKIANLQLRIQGAPVKKRTEFPVKTTITGDGEQKVEAKLSDEEKARILMDTINRILGETGDEK